MTYIVTDTETPEMLCLVLAIIAVCLRSMSIIHSYHDDIMMFDCHMDSTCSALALSFSVHEQVAVCVGSE